MAIDPSQKYDLLDRLADEFAARFRRGERPALKEYLDQYPELADDIREIFPAMVEIERVEEGRLDGGDTIAARAASPQRQVGDYRILREIGRGGMGVVYEAEQVSLGRRVALKILPLHASKDRKALERFRREARSAARLHHTNIVPVFEVGRDGDVCYYAMQFIQGQGLDQIVEELRRLRSDAGTGSKAHPPVAVPPASPRASGSQPSPPSSALARAAHSLLTGRFQLEGQESLNHSAEPLTDGYQGGEGLTGVSLELEPSPTSSAVLPGREQLSSIESDHQHYFRSVGRIGHQTAAALAHAHARGIVHRDVKPSNLLLDTAGVVWVTDFGLAKMEDDGLTNTGDLVGTLRYMAPERFQGECDPRADVYALGLTLYELLTLRPAFDSPNRMQLIDQIRSCEAARPRVVDPRVPRDLETIVLKAIDKDPRRRYTSADALAEDLRRFISDEPIQARRVSAPERLARWCRRHPGVAFWAVCCVLAVVAGVAGVSWKWWEADDERVKARAAEKEATRQRDEAKLLSAQVSLDKGLTLAEQGDIGGGLLWMLESLKAAPGNAKDLHRLVRCNLSAWREYAHGLRHVFKHARPLYACAFSPDGKRLAIGGEEGTGGMVRILDVETGQTLGPALAHGGPVMGLAFSPDGKSLLAATYGTNGEEAETGHVYRWDAATGRALGPPQPVPRGATEVAFHPEGRCFAAGGRDGKARIWETSTGRLLATLSHGPDPVSALAFSPDGKSLLTGAGGALGTVPDTPRTAVRWDVVTGKRLEPAVTHPGNISSVAFAPDGRTLLTAGADHSVRLWGVAEGKPQGQHLMHSHQVNVARFTPDGRMVLTGDEDGLVHWWDARTGHLLLGSLPGHAAGTKKLALSPEGLLVGSVSSDQTARIWEVARSWSQPAERTNEVVTRAPEVGEEGIGYLISRSTAFHPERRSVLSGSRIGMARLWDMRSGQPLGAPLAHPWATVRNVAFSPTGNLVATTSNDVTVATSCQLWDAATGRPVGPPLPHDNWVSGMAFRPDGKVLATGGYDTAVHLWDTATGQRLGPPLPQKDIVLSLAFSPDGRTLAVGLAPDYSKAPGVILWDLDSRQPRGSLLPSPEIVTRILFTPDGKTLLAQGFRGLRLWDVVSGKPLSPRLSEESTINALVLSADGRFFLTGAKDGRVRLWDTARGEPLGPPLSHAAPVHCLAFSQDPEAPYVLVGCGDGSTWLWDRTQFRPVGPPVRQHRKISGVAFAPDGHSFFTTSEDGDTRAWPVPAPLDGSPERLSLALQVRTGLEMGPGRVIVRLSPEDWGQRHEAGAAAGALGSSMDVPSWHEARARDGEQAGDGFAAQWHLDRLFKERADDWRLYARRARVQSRAGRFEAAARDYDQARKWGAGPALLDWYRHRAVECEEAGQWPGALWYLDRAIAAAPRDWRLFWSRARVRGKLGQSDGRAADEQEAVKQGAEGDLLLGPAREYASHQQWARAADLYQAMARTAPPALPFWNEYALLLLKKGDRAAYRGVCEKLIRVHGNATSLGDANAVAWTCALGPGGLEDYHVPLALAERVVSRASPELKHGVLNTLGTVLYRAGRDREALEKLREGIASDRGEGLVQDWLLLAMIHHRLNHPAESRQWLDKARAHPLQNNSSTPWENLEIEVLRDEAEALLKEKPDHQP